jgi:hypothetical protein
LAYTCVAVTDQNPNASTGETIPNLGKHVEERFGFFPISSA